MADNGWYVEVHGDRVALSLPGSDGGEGTAIDMSASEARGLATALTDAADAISSS